MPSIKGIESMLKGCIAETLVHQLFTVSGIPVWRMGYEYRMLDFLNSNQAFRGGNDAYKRLQLAPDLAIINGKGELEYVEVKYRQQGRFHENDIPDLPLLDEWWGGPKIVMLSYNILPHFCVVPAPYKRSVSRDPLEAHSLLEEKDWKIAQSALTECESQMKIFQHFLDMKESRKSSGVLREDDADYEV